MLEGDLGEFSLPEVLQLLATTRRSGTLTLHGPVAVGRLQLADGELVEISADVARVGVARRLLAQGLVGPEPIEDVLRQAEQLPGDRRLLTLLVARGTLDAELAAQVARAQAIDQLADLLTWEEGSFRFDRDDGLGNGPAVRSHLNSEELLAAATAQRDAARQRDAALARIATLEAAHHPGRVIDLPAVEADASGSHDQAAAPHGAEPVAASTGPDRRAALDAAVAPEDDDPQARPLVTTVRADRLRTDPTIDEELVSRLIDGVKEL